jgi:hypothetical protein
MKINYKIRKKIQLSLLLSLFFLSGVPLIAQESPLLLKPEADSYVSGGASEEINYGTSYLQIKSAGDPGTAGSRKAYVRFDLSSIPAKKKIEAAKLTLFTYFWTESSTCTFHLYGLKDGIQGDAAVGWVESEITWKNAPANNTEHHFMFNDNAIFLDSVTFSNTGASFEEVTFSSSILDSILNKDTNGFVTFMVSRSTVTWNYNTNFQSRENETFSPVLELTLVDATTGINNNKIAEGDMQFQCSPNPFSSVLSISYTLPEKQWIKLSVYDITGKELMVLAEGFQNPGTYQVELNGDILPKHGAYVIRLNDRNNSIAEKVIYAKKS